jgi:predicted AlkP superfamily pyrophosphatase or phosphodiesterase
MKRVFSAALALSAILFMGACAPKETAQTEPIASHVILIGLDGWGTWCMEKGECPFIREMMQEGSFTLNKRTVLPSSSGPNWAAMMNGTPVEATGIISNNATPDFKPLVLTEHNAQPTFFHQLKQVCPEAETGVICEWGDFMNYTDPACVDYQKKIEDPETFTEAVVEESVKYIQEKKPVLCFIHIDALDHKGHANGQGSPEYYAELPLVDSRVQRIVEGIKAAGIYEDSIIMLTSDHGHLGTGHGGTSMLEMETPFVIWGKGVKKNHEIQETVLEYDIAATVAKILNLPVPQSWRGIPMDVFE